MSRRNNVPLPVIDLGQLLGIPRPLASDANLGNVLGEFVSQLNVESEQRRRRTEEEEANADSAGRDTASGTRQDKSVVRETESRKRPANDNNDGGVQESMKKRPASRNQCEEANTKKRPAKDTVRIASTGEDASLPSQAPIQISNKPALLMSSLSEANRKHTATEEMDSSSSTSSAGVAHDTNNQSVSHPNATTIRSDEMELNESEITTDSLSLAANKAVVTTDSLSTAANNKAVGVSSVIGEIEHCREIRAPSGRLQVLIHDTRNGPAVYQVRNKSPLTGQALPGDVIIAIDDDDTRALGAEQVVKMLTERGDAERKITVLRYQAVVNEEMGTTSVVGMTHTTNNNDMPSNPAQDGNAPDDATAVRSDVTELNESEITTDSLSLASNEAVGVSSVTGEIEHCREIRAPPGRLHVFIRSTRNGPTVYRVRDESPLTGQALPGDVIIAIDDDDTRALGAEQVGKMLTERGDAERKITVLRYQAVVNEEMGIQVSLFYFTAPRTLIYFTGISEIAQPQ